MADPITLPIRLFRVPASSRDADDLLRLLDGAAAIWEQADIELELEGAVETLPDDPSRRTLNDILGQDDGGSVAGFAIPAPLPGVPNGRANPSTRRFMVGDTTIGVPEVRVFAHELGHVLLGVRHVEPPDDLHLMVKGRSGTTLTAAEIQTARAKAAAL